MSAALTRRERCAVCPTRGVPRGHAVAEFMPGTLPRTPMRPKRKCGDARAPPHPLGSTALSLHRRADLRQMMEAVAHRVVLEHELAGHRCVVVERVRRDPVEIGVRNGPQRGCGLGAVLL